MPLLDCWRWVIFASEEHHGAKNQTKRFEGGDLGYDLGKIWCILAGKLGWTKAILMASRQFFMV